MALGATRVSVVALMLRESAGYAAAGLAAGTALAIASSRMLRGLLFEVPATDPATYATFAFLVAGLVVAAGRRAARQT